MQSTEEFWSRKQFSEAPNNIENWLMARQRIGKPYILAVSSFFPFFAKTNLPGLLCMEFTK